LDNIDLNDTLKSNGDDEHLVEGQVQGGVEMMMFLSSQLRGRKCFY